MVLNKAFHWNCQNVQLFFPVYLNIELSLCPGFNDITHGDINHCTITGQSRLCSVIPCLITNCTPGDNDNRANRKHSNASIGGMSPLPVVYTWAVLAGASSTIAYLTKPWPMPSLTWAESAVSTCRIAYLDNDLPDDVVGDS